NEGAQGRHGDRPELVQADLRERIVPGPEQGDAEEQRVGASVGHGVGSRWGRARRWNGPAGMGPTGPSATSGALLLLFLLRGLLLRHVMSPPSRSPRVTRSICPDNRGGQKTCQGENTG